MKYVFEEDLKATKRIVDFVPVMKLPKGKRSKTFTIESSVKRGQEIPYVVYCNSTRDFAEGGTAPRMIIED